MDSKHPGAGGELLPCPFCGGAMTAHFQLIRHATEPKPGKCAIRQNAWAIEMIDVWNTRALTNSTDTAGGGDA